MNDKNPQPPSPAARPRPTSAQIWRQIGLIVLVVALWAGLFAVYLSLGACSPTAATPAPQPTQPAAPTGGPTTTPAAVATQPGPTATEPPAPGETPTVSFARDVLPLLQTRCERCHGGSRAQSGFSVSSYAQVMAGSESGPVITPGNSATSLLVKLIVSGQMPRGAPRLPDSEIEIIRSWIDQGARDN